MNWLLKYAHRNRPVVVEDVLTYYLDGTNGDDANDGLGMLTAWKTWTPHNAATIPAVAYVRAKKGTTIGGDVQAQLKADPYIELAGWTKKTVAQYQAVSGNAAKAANTLDRFRICECGNIESTYHQRWFGLSVRNGKQDRTADRSGWSCI